MFICHCPSCTQHESDEMAYWASLHGPRNVVTRYPVPATIGRVGITEHGVFFEYTNEDDTLYIFGMN